MYEWVLLLPLLLFIPPIAWIIRYIINERKAEKTWITKWEGNVKKE